MFKIWVSKSYFQIPLNLITPFNVLVNVLVGHVSKTTLLILDLVAKKIIKSAKVSVVLSLKHVLDLIHPSHVISATKAKFVVFS